MGAPVPVRELLYGLYAGAVAGVVRAIDEAPAGARLHVGTRDLLQWGTLAYGFLPATGRRVDVNALTFGRARLSLVGELDIHYDDGW